MLKTHPKTNPTQILALGGSFNPIHNGHLEIVRFVRDKLGFHRIILVPNGDSYRKADLVQAAIRLAMVQIAVDGEPGVEITDVEARSDIPMRNVLTLNEIREQYPDDELYLYRGLDALRKTHRDLFKIRGLKVLILDREGFADKYERVVASRRQLRENRDRLQYLAGQFRNSYSSTAVRKAVKEGGEIDEMVPPGVARIIREYGLYKEAF